MLTSVSVQFFALALPTNSRDSERLRRVILRAGKMGFSMVFSVGAITVGEIQTGQWDLNIVVSHFTHSTDESGFSQLHF